MYIILRYLRHSSCAFACTAMSREVLILDRWETKCHMCIHACMCKMWEAIFAGIHVDMN